MNVIALLILSAPCSAGNLKNFFKRCNEVLRNLSALVPLFCTIFRENSIKLRRSFFKNPLIKHFWTQYKEDEGAFTKKYLS